MEQKRRRMTMVARQAVERELALRQDRTVLQLPPHLLACVSE